MWFRDYRFSTACLCVQPSKPPWLFSSNRPPFFHIVTCLLSHNSKTLVGDRNTARTKNLVARRTAHVAENLTRFSRPEIKTLGPIVLSPRVPDHACSGRHRKLACPEPQISRQLALSGQF